MHTFGLNPVAFLRCLWPILTSAKNTFSSRVHPKDWVVMSNSCQVFYRGRRNRFCLRGSKLDAKICMIISGEFVRKIKHDIQVVVIYIILMRFPTPSLLNIGYSRLILANKQVIDFTKKYDQRLSNVTTKITPQPPETNDDVLPQRPYFQPSLDGFFGL